MVSHITSKCVSCLDIIPSGSLLTLCPLNKTEQLVGDQNWNQGSPPMDDLLSTTAALIKDDSYQQPLFHGPLAVFSRHVCSGAQRLQTLALSSGESQWIIDLNP